MKDQINTIREALEAVDNGCQANNLDFALNCLAQLEAMVGEQEPVAWMGIPVMPGRYKEAVFCSDKDLAMRWDYSGHTGLGRLIVTPLYAAPVAQQYEAGDVASAAAQGFRDGVASTQPLLNEAIDRINDMLKDDDGQAYKEARKFVDRVAQQPPAMPMQCKCFDEVAKKYCADKGKCSQAVAQVAQQPHSTEALRQMLGVANEGDPARWEIGFRNIVAILYGPKHSFEIKDVVERVREIAQQPQKLEDIEQYRMQMAGISTAAIGYWKEGDSIHPDYDTLALRDVAKLYAKYDALYKAQQPQAEAVPDDVGQLEYRGNSVAYIHQKMTAYRGAIDAAWQAMRDAGRPPDGCTPLAQAITKALAPQQAEAVPPDVLSLLREAREALWQPSNPDLCERIDAAIAQQKGQP